MLINEVYYDSPGADGPNVFTELCGPPGTVLDGWTLVSINLGTVANPVYERRSGPSICIAGIRIPASAARHAGGLATDTGRALVVGSGSEAEGCAVARAVAHAMGRRPLFIHEDDVAPAVCQVASPDTNALTEPPCGQPRGSCGRPQGTRIQLDPLVHPKHDLLADSLRALWLHQGAASAFGVVGQPTEPCSR